MRRIWCAHARTANNTLIIIVALRSGVCKVTAHRAVVNVGGLVKVSKAPLCVHESCLQSAATRAHHPNLFSASVRLSLPLSVLINGILREMPAATPKLGPICLADEGDAFNWTDTRHVKKPPR